MDEWGANHLRGGAIDSVLWRNNQLCDYWVLMLNYGWFLLCYQFWMDSMHGMCQCSMDVMPLSILFFELEVNLES